MSRIRKILAAADGPHRYDALLDDFDHAIIPNLEAFPQVGKPYIGNAQQSAEALMAVARLPRDARSTVQQYSHDDYVILYALAPDMIHIVAIRHHDEAGFAP